MSERKSDVLVVGGGLAGCVAAQSVLQAGKNVTVICSNGGISEISAGAVDVLGVIPGEKPQICGRYMEAVPSLLEKYPNHVYKDCGKELQAGLDALVSLAGDGGYVLEGFDGANVWVPNMMGTFSVNALVPEMMYDGVCVPGKKERVLVIGIEGNVAFHAAAAAVSYGQYQKKLGGAAEYYSAVIRIEGWGDRRKISDGELADYLDTPEGIAELTDKLTTFCRNNRYGFDRILLPPVLGYINYGKNLKKLKEACGCGASEIEAIGNSVVGYRLTRALYRGLERHGATLVRGALAKSVAVDKDGVCVKAVLGLTDQVHPGTPVTFEGNALILATGGFVGGGIKARRTEVWIELLNQKLGRVEADQLDRDALSKSGQGFLKMGVEVRSDMSVRDEAFGGRVYACGSLLAGKNSASERSGAGIAAASAYLAGLHAASKN